MVEIAASRSRWRVAAILALSAFFVSAAGFSVTVFSAALGGIKSNQMVCSVYKSRKESEQYCKCFFRFNFHLVTRNIRSCLGHWLSDALDFREYVFNANQAQNENRTASTDLIFRFWPASFGHFRSICVKYILPWIFQGKYNFSPGLG